MSIVEIIHLRSAGKPVEILSEQIKESIGASEGLAEVIMIYHRDGLETDLAIHIHHPEMHRREPSIFGHQLASELKTHGLIEHTVWKELK